MSEFTASNGIGVEINEDEQIIFEVPNRPTTPMWVTNGEIDALREYIIAQEDKRLGRWRWPENPNYLVYPVGEGLVDVLREAGVSDQTRGPGREQGISREKAVEWDRDYSLHFYEAAAAYFDAHPEPKPWHDAKPGDVWALTVDGEESAFYPSKSLDRAFTPVKPESGRTAVSFDSFEITAGRRIWPEGDES